MPVKTWIVGNFLNASELNPESLDCKRQSLINPNSVEGPQSLLGDDPHKLQGYVYRLLNMWIQKWVVFSAVWNEVSDHFREEDLISNRWRFGGFSQAIYLPVFQTAGVVEDASLFLRRCHSNCCGSWENEPGSDSYQVE